MVLKEPDGAFLSGSFCLIWVKIIKFILVDREYRIEIL